MLLKLICGKTQVIAGDQEAQVSHGEGVVTLAGVIILAGMHICGKVQVGKDQEKAQSERDSHSKNRGGKKTKLTIRHLYHETYRKPNEQLFSQ